MFSIDNIVLNCFAVHTETMLRRYCHEDNVAVVTLAFSKKISVFAGVFKFIHFGECFQKVRFLGDRKAF